MEKKFIRIKEASLILGVHPQTLRRWEKKGLIKPVRIGLKRERRYNLNVLKELLEIRGD
ncbi:MAG: MerR family DNA-binding transcriptional regulator [candidate division WOR-3 bacterium]